MSALAVAKQEKSLQITWRSCDSPSHRAWIDPFWRRKVLANMKMTYNWYEPGAQLGRHLHEHHEETKGSKGWLFPTRRSVTWLVYLNDAWQNEEGGALHTFPRKELSSIPQWERTREIYKWDGSIMCIPFLGCVATRGGIHNLASVKKTRTT